MSRPRPEPLHVVKARRDTALRALVGNVPWIAFMGIKFERMGDELTATLPFDDKLIGNPMLPALHGGATAAFLEVAAIIELTWSMLWPQVESGEMDLSDPDVLQTLRFPKTIDMTVDYLRTGLPRDSYARARVTRSGRRYASVHVEGWQDNRAKPYAQAAGHFLMPARD